MRASRAAKSSAPAADSSAARRSALAVASVKITSEASGASPLWRSSRAFWSKPLRPPSAAIDAS